MKTRALFAGLLLAGLAGCTAPTGAPAAVASSPVPVTQSPSPEPTPTEPATAEAAKAAAQEFLDRRQSGDYAGAWELFTDEAKAAISQADYVKYRTVCTYGSGIKLTVTSSRLSSADTAIVRVEALGATLADTMKYEHGQWLAQPTAAVMKAYASGVAEMIKADKKAGTCT